MMTQKGSLLLLGDCVDKMSEIADGSIDFVLADPPYGTTKCKWDVIIPLDIMWKHLRRVIKPNGAIAIFGQEPFSSALRMSNTAMFRYDWYWEKDRAANFLFANKMPMKTVEIVSVFYERQPTYHSQKTVNPRGESKRHLSKNPAKISRNVKDIMGDSWRETTMNETQNYHGKYYEPDKLLAKQTIYFPKVCKGRVHPTEKPVPLLEYLVRTYTDEGDVVLDFAMGSGSTGVACANMGRRFVGIEIDEGYFSTAEQRVVAAEQSAGRG